MTTLRTTFGGTPVDLRKRVAHGGASPAESGGGTPTEGTEAVTPVRHTPTEITHRGDNSSDPGGGSATASGGSTPPLPNSAASYPPDTKLGEVMGRHFDRSQPLRDLGE